MPGEVVKGPALQDWANSAEDQLFAIPAAARIRQMLAEGEPLLVYARWQGGFVALLDVVRLCRLYQELYDVA